MPTEATHVPDCDVIVFEAPYKQRARTIIHFAFGGIALFVIWTLVAALVYGLLAWVHRASAILAAAAASLVLTVGLYVTWKVLLGIPRFRIALAPGLVMVGGRYWKDEVSNGDVEVISPPAEKREHGVMLEFGGRKALVYLSPTDEAQCLALLWKRCENALFIDRTGQEYLPRSASRPRLTLSAYYRKLRARVWLGVCTVGVIGGAGLAIGASILEQPRQNGPGRDWAELTHLGMGIVASVSLIVWGVWYAKVNWSKMRVVGERLSAAHEKEGAAD